MSWDKQINLIFKNNKAYKHKNILNKFLDNYLTTMNKYDIIYLTIKEKEFLI